MEGEDFRRCTEVRRRNESECRELMLQVSVSVSGALTVNDERSETYLSEMFSLSRRDDDCDSFRDDLVPFEPLHLDVIPRTMLVLLRHLSTVREVQGP